MYLAKWLCVAFYLAFLTLVTGDKVVRIVPESHEHVRLLRELRDDGGGLKIDFWKHPSKVGIPVDIHVDDASYEAFSRDMSTKRISYDVRIPDVQKLLDESQQTSRAHLGSFHSKYHNWQEIHSEMSSLAQRRRDMHIRVFDIGYTTEGRPMKAIEIKGRPLSDKPVFFWECGIHAREWISPATCMYSMEQMINGYGKDRSVTDLLDKMDFIILPVLNVDGYAYTWTNDRLWRKNRRRDYSGCIGTDLNRNWSYKWGVRGASHLPCDRTFMGRQPFSEVETRNVRDFLKTLGKRLKGFIDMHAYGQFWFTPWGYTGTETPPHYKEQTRVAKIATQAIKRVHGKRYEYGSSAKLIYAAAGGSEDWVYHDLGVHYAFSVELRDTGRHGFLLPAEQITPTGEETFEGIKALGAAMKV